MDLSRGWMLATLAMSSSFLLAGCEGGTVMPKDAKKVSGSQTSADAAAPRLSIESEPDGMTPDGQPIVKYHLSNANGMTVSIINLGGIVTNVSVPDRDGRFENVTLAFDSSDDYLANSPYLGAICGRYANRIAKGRFTIDGTEYKLATNNEPNHLHGGVKGFNKAVWRHEPIESADSVGVRLSYTSPDGDEGYPGNLTTTVIYTLTNNDELRIDYEATSDKATPINLTNHCYWNLAGSGTILDHELTLNCEKYLPVDETLIPTGEQHDVAGTPMDFRKAKKLGAEIDTVAGGYDHCFVFRTDLTEPQTVARVHDPKSGRVMEISTTEPGVQLYTGNFLDGTAASGGYSKHGGLCLECQHFPDSPNQAGFPNVIYRPAQVYRQSTVHKFSVQK